METAKKRVLILVARPLRLLAPPPPPSAWWPQKLSSLHLKKVLSCPATKKRTFFAASLMIWKEFFKVHRSQASDYPQSLDHISARVQCSHRFNFASQTKTILQFPKSLLKNLSLKILFTPYLQGLIGSVSLGSVYYWFSIEKGELMKPILEFAVP